MAFTGDRLRHGLSAIRASVDEVVILSTCNRTELYVADRDIAWARQAVNGYLIEHHDVPANVLLDASYSLTGEDAVRHLLRVSSGLDSLVLGEPQILAQIRDALAEARTAAAAGPLLTRLVNDALHIGKRARTETSIARNRLSVAHAAVELASRDLGGLVGRYAVVIGAGKMATLAARLLAAAGITELTIANRTMEHGAALATSLGARAVSLERLPEAVEGAEVVIGAVLVDAPILRPEHLAQRGRPLCVIDLGMPRIVSPEVGRHPSVAYFDIDALERVTAERRRQVAPEIAKVEQVIDEGVSEYAAWVRGRGAAAIIGEIRQEAEDMRAVELERALRRLQHLSARDQNVVRALATGLTNKLLHQPISHLRDQPDAAELRLARHLYGLDENDGTRV